MPRNLSDAARGYIYQDVVTAYFLAVAMYEEQDKVVVDRKEFDGDIFDDLTVVREGIKVRRQFKSSADATKEFSEKILRTTTSDLRIDDVTDCWKKSVNNPANEYRICSTWAAPIIENANFWLVPTNAPSSFEGYKTSCFKLNTEALWPTGKNFAWTLAEREKKLEEFSRVQFLDLSKHLIIELNCPQISLDWDAPGELESLLLLFLTDKIGVGRPPNETCSPVSVARALVERAMYARMRQETIAVNSLMRDVGLRVDYGKLPQNFPLRSREFVERPEFLKIQQAIREGRNRIAVSGPPGTGKSWLLTKSGEMLAAENIVVLRHYCFVDPQDAFKVERITIKAMYANLTASLSEQIPLKEAEFGTKLGASRQDFEKRLNSAASKELGRKIVIIVDGLDHIARIKASTSDLSAAQIAIINELATLPLPPNVCLIVGSQPISDLDELGIEQRIDMESWSTRDSLLLLKRNVFLDFLLAVKAGSGASLLRGLIKKSDGNPLYLYYLSVSLRHVSNAEDLKQRLTEMPELNGDLTKYYFYILGGDSPSALARLFATVNFSLSERDLKEIFPFFKTEITSWLEPLRPVLSAVTSQGGYRIYHDSFRQFVSERSVTSGNAVVEAHSALITWLQTKGFFEDVRSYANLFKLLKVANRTDEILALITPSFIAGSIAWLHAEEAIRSNLSLVAEIAATSLDWALMVRLSELHRMLHTVFDEHIRDVELYGKAFAAVNGVEALSERLLYESLPRFDIVSGLELCSLVDVSKGLPPWNAYYSQLTESEEDDNADLGFHAFCRTHEKPEVLESLRRFLVQKNIDFGFVRRTLNRISSVFGRSAIRWLTKRLPAHRTRLAFEICLAMARTYRPKSYRRRFYANSVRYFARNTEQIKISFNLGAAVDRRCLSKRLQQMVREINRSTGRVKASFLTEWSSCIYCASTISTRRLIGLRSKIIPHGWFQVWARYSIDLVILRTSRNFAFVKKEKFFLSRLRKVCEFDTRFDGSSRIFDLYESKKFIKTGVINSLLFCKTSSLLRVIKLFHRMAQNLSVRMQNSEMGPFDVEDLVECIMEVSVKRRLPKSVLNYIQDLIDYGILQGSFFDVQSTMRMKISILFARSGDMQKAKQHWFESCRLLCGYGQRKDRTIFELIEGFPKQESTHRLAMLQKLRPLIDRVKRFTDGKGTDSARNEFFSLVCEMDDASAALLLLRSIVKGGYEETIYDSCLQHLVLNSASRSNPILGAHLLSMTKYVSGFENLENALTLLERAGDMDASLMPFVLSKITDWPLSLHFAKEPEMFNRLKKFAEKFAVEIPLNANRLDKGPSKPYEKRSSGQEPIFPQNASVTTMIRVMRECSTRDFEQRPFVPKLMNTIFFKALELFSEGDSDGAEHLIFFFRDHYYLSEKGEFLEGLADGFFRYGLQDFSAKLFADAFVNSRGGLGWLQIGDESHYPILERGVQISREQVVRELFERVRAILSRPGYSMGITQNFVLLAQKFENFSTALACWQEALNIVELRLQTHLELNSIFEGPLEQQVDWTFDELCIGLLFATGCASPKALEFAIRSLPRQTGKILSYLFPIASSAVKFKTLRILCDSEPPPYVIVESIKGVLKDSSLRSIPLTRLIDELMKRTETGQGNV